MGRRRKLLLFGKWAATAMCVALAVVWIRGGSYDLSIAESPTHIRFGAGLMSVSFRSPIGVNYRSYRPPPRWYGLPVINNVILTRFEVNRAPGKPPYSVTDTQLLIPMLWPAAALAVLTVLLWRLDRRRPVPGHCLLCGYNLTGLTELRCPECGEPAECG